MAEADIKALEADFYEKFAQLTAKQQRFFTEYVINGLLQVEAFKLAYDCSNMKPNVIETKASREANKGKFRVSKIAFCKWKNADTISDRREVEETLLAIATVRIDDIAYIDEKTGKLKSRTLNTMTKRAKMAAIVEMSPKQGMTIKFGNKVSAAAELARMRGWEAAQEVKHTGLVHGDLGDVVIRLVNKDGGEDS